MFSRKLNLKDFFYLSIHSVEEPSSSSDSENVSARDSYAYRYVDQKTGGILSQAVLYKHPPNTYGHVRAGFTNPEFWNYPGMSDVKFAYL